MSMRSFLIRDILSGGGGGSASAAHHHQTTLGPIGSASAALANLQGAPLVALPGTVGPSIPPSLVGIDQHQAAAAAAAAAQSLAAAQARFLAKWAEHQQQLQASKYLEQFRQQQQQQPSNGPLDHQQLLSNLNLSQQQQQQLQAHLQQHLNHANQRQASQCGQALPLPRLHSSGNTSGELEHDNHDDDDDDDDDCEIEVDERPTMNGGLAGGRGRHHLEPVGGPSCLGARSRQELASDRVGRNGVDCNEAACRHPGAGDDDDDENDDARHHLDSLHRERANNGGHEEEGDEEEEDQDDDEDQDEDQEEEILDVNCAPDGMLQHNQELASERRQHLTGSNSNKHNTLQASQFQQQLNSPLDALFQMTSSTFDALKRGEKRKDRDTTHHGSSTNFANKQSSKKKRKSRTAFTNNQIYELERRFRMQKYLSPTDRDEIAMTLNLSNAQVITWFQNRRAKMKRDLEEQKRDIETASLLNLHKTFLESFQALSQMKTAIKPANASGLCGPGGTTITEDGQLRDQQVG